jgi:hypothetical protein
MIEKSKYQLARFVHGVDRRCVERAPLQESSPAAWDFLDQDLASVIRDYGPGSTPEQRALRVRLAESRRLLRFYE